MAKIPRVTFKPFGANANAAADVCEFGTPATGAPVYTADIATLQANAAWLLGWAAETIASNRPFLEDMNAMSIVFGNMIAYLMQSGIAEYDSGTTYYIGSVVMYNGVPYQSLTDTNLGNTPAVGANWKLFIALSTVTIPSILDYGTSASTSTPVAQSSLKIAYGHIPSVGAGSTVSLSNLPFSSASSYVIVCSNGTPSTLSDENAGMISGHPTSGSAAIIYNTDNAAKDAYWYAIGS